MPIKIESVREAKIVEWDDLRGFGFLQVGKGRVFLHRREFAERHKRPEVGDVIRFTVGVDAHGRTCAKEATHVNDGGRFTLVAMVILLGLLVLPAFAIYRSGLNWRWAAGYAVVTSLISYGRYATDKRRARENKQRELAAKAEDEHYYGKSRVSEAGLHFTELLGGWPGAYVAQRRLRHKVSKRRYQVIFWMIVMGWQLAALDSLQRWKYSQAAWEQVGKKAMEWRGKWRGAGITCESTMVVSCGLVESFGQVSGATHENMEGGPTKASHRVTEFPAAPCIARNAGRWAGGAVDEMVSFEGGVRLVISGVWGKARD